MRKAILALLVMVCTVSAAPKKKELEKKRVIDIYIYETLRKDYTTSFYSWIEDTDGGDCEIDGTVSEIEVGWLQAGAIYLENKGGHEGKGLKGQIHFTVTIADPQEGFYDGGSTGGVKIWFGKLDNERWDGKIYIEVPYKSIYKIRRTVRKIE